MFYDKCLKFYIWSRHVQTFFWNEMFRWNLEDLHNQQGTPAARPLNTYTCMPTYENIYVFQRWDWEISVPFLCTTSLWRGLSERNSATKLTCARQWIMKIFPTPILPIEEFWRKEKNAIFLNLVIGKWNILTR